MSEEYFPTAADFAAMTFRDKFILTRAITKSDWAKLLVALMVTGLILALAGFFLTVFLDLGPDLRQLAEQVALNPADPWALSLTLDRNFIIRFLLTYFLLALLAFFLETGLNTLIVKYVSGREPGRLLAEIFSPWARPARVLLCGLAWIGLSQAVDLMLSVMAQMPALGSALKLFGLIFLKLLGQCYIFYLADHPKTTATLALATSFQILRRHWRGWLTALLLTLALTLPPGLMVALGLFTLARGGYIFFPALLIGAGSLYLAVAVIFSLVFTGVTYQQTKSAVLGDEMTNSHSSSSS
ncbi:MAG: hypothetical protein LBP55_03825 [Candidatus Adiutrix sp.]|jgi:hypothetical protein|nr:hypothetical protein [Candidatus Adiutrix sp.]